MSLLLEQELLDDAWSSKDPNESDSAQRNLVGRVWDWSLARFWRKKQLIPNTSLWWKASLSPDGQFLALLNDRNVVIRRAETDFGHPEELLEIKESKHPERRILCWVESLGSSRPTVFVISDGVLYLVRIYDRKIRSLNIRKVCSLPPDSIADVRVAHARRGTYVLHILSYNSQLLRLHLSDPFLVGALSDSCVQSLVPFSLSRQHPFGSISLDLHAERNLIGVGGIGSKDEEKPTISLWQVEMEEPWYRFVGCTDVARKSSAAAAKCKCAQLLISPSGTRIVCVDFKRGLTVWSTSDFSCLQSISPLTLTSISPLFGPVSEFHTNFIDCSWWSDESVVFAFRTGRIEIISLDDMRSLLADDDICSSPVSGTNMRITRVARRQHFFLLSSGPGS